MASVDSTHRSNFQNINELLQTEIRPEDIQTNCILNKGSIGSKGSKGSGSSLSGGNGEMIDLNTFKVLIVLAHGRIELNQASVLTPEIHPTMDVNAFPNVENLAYISIAPTGIVNIGTTLELYAYKSLIDNELIKALEQEVMKLQFTTEIQQIEDKANEIVGDKKLKLSEPSIQAPSIPALSILAASRQPSSRQTSSPPPPYQETPSSSHQSFFSRICKFCFRIIPSRDIIERFMRSISIGEIVGYSFKGLFNICKNVLPSISLDGGAKRTRQTNNTSLCSISPDMCVMLLDGLRKSIKDFDSKRFDVICNNLKYSRPSLDIHPIISNKIHRCRKLNIIKGFGSSEVLPFVNKYLVYNTLADKIMNMGVSILSFKVNSSGKVKCVIEDIDGEELMKNITQPMGKIVDPSNPSDITYWSNMQDCISQCTASYGPKQTFLVIDLSCSSFSFTAHNPIDSMLIGLPGGNKNNINNKKSRTKSRTRKIKNKSKNIKYKRNRRRLINKTKKTKKYN